MASASNISKVESQDDTPETQQDPTSSKTVPSLLPELWEGIFKELSPIDFLCAINSCMEWNQLAHSQKTFDLISLVSFILSCPS